MKQRQNVSDEELEQIEAWRKAFVEQRQKRFEQALRRQWVERDGKTRQIVRKACFDPKQIEAELKSYWKKSGLKEAEKHQNLREIWYTVVGPEIADHTTPVRFRNGVLTVEISSPALRQELESFCKEELLSDMRKALGATPLRNIRFELKAGRE